MAGCATVRLLTSKAFVSGSEVKINSKLEIRNKRARLDFLFDIRICFEFRISNFGFCAHFLKERFRHNIADAFR